MEEQFKSLIVLSHYLEVCPLAFLHFLEHVAQNVLVLHALQTARFQQFWDEAAKSRHILEVVPGTHKF